MRYEIAGTISNGAFDSAVDFDGLKDVAHDSSMVSAEASCLTCRQEFGKIRQLDIRVLHVPQKPTSSSWFGGGAIKGILKVSASSKKVKASGTPKANKALTPEAAPGHA